MMKRTLPLITFVLLLMIIPVFAQVNHHYVISLKYSQGNLSYQKISLEPSQSQLKTPEGFYIAEVVSFDNKILNFTYFDIPTTIFVDSINPQTGEIDSGAIMEKNESEAVLYVPYYETAEEINIYDWDLKKKLRIDVSSYAAEAGPSVKETTVGELEKEEISEKEEDAMGGKKPFPIAILLLLVLGILLFLLLLFLISRIKRVQPKEKT